tara:strand:- start:287 stop:439 length:153 start_codon:yes stop_codon:yes gene_type:complete
MRVSLNHPVQPRCAYCVAELCVRLGMHRDGTTLAISNDKLKPGIAIQCVG